MARNRLRILIINMVNRFTLMLTESIERASRALEEKFRRYVTDSGQGIRLVVIADDIGIGPVTAHPELESAARDFVSVIAFTESLAEPRIDTRPYKERMERQGISINYKL